MTRRSAFSSAPAILVLAGCGDDGSDAVREQVDANRPTARWTSTSSTVRASPATSCASVDGKTGKKLQWDLDANGRIDRSERTITEQELYAATVQ